MSNPRQRLIAQNAKLIRTRILSIPVEGEDPIQVGLRSPSLAQAESFALGDGAAQSRSMVKVVIACTFDPETNKPLFTDADEDLLLGAPASGGWIGSVVETMGELMQEARDGAKN